MTYDLDRAINIATQDAYDDLQGAGLTDLSNDNAKSIIADHAQDVVPMYDGQLLDVYMQHQRHLMTYEPGITLQDNTGADRDPYINTQGLRTAIHWLAIERIHDNLDDLINAD